MAVEVKVPVFPESVTDGTVVIWHKKPGDVVTRDENLVDIETDKVVFEVPAPDSGVLLERLEQEGAIVTPGQLLTRIDTKANGAKVAAKTVTEKLTVTASSPAAQGFLTPSAERLVNEHKLDVSRIEATGKGGRILKEDVLRFMEQPDQQPKQQPTLPVAPEPATAKLATGTVADAAVQSTPVAMASAGMSHEGRVEKRVPMTRLRARIAERLVQAQQNAAILTTFNEVNMKPVMDLRAKYRDKFEKDYGVRLGFMSFFVKASVEALKRFPEINASIDGNDVVYHGFFDVGIAVSSPRGLVVPILRDVDQMSVAEIETSIGHYSQMAKNGTLTMDDITGGTFTITNGGVFGSLLSTPIINPPQSGILGMHKIQERVMVENGEMVIRPMMYLALSYDHRIVDGQGAVQFLVTIKELLEDPARIMLAV